MISRNVTGMSSRNLHTYLGFEYEVYKKDARQKHNNICRSLIQSEE